MRAAPSAGELRHRITLRRVSDAPVGAFALERAYPEQLPTWAAKRQVSPGVYHVGVQSGDRVTHEFAFRRRAGLPLGDDWEVLHGGVVYRVRRVYDIEPGFTGLDCEELQHG